MHILGIETSCDDTAVAIIRDDGTILANLVQSQITEHACFGGVVPEIAARAHLHYLPNLVKMALQQADLQLNQIGLIAATAGPGLIGGVIVGTMMAKAMAAACDIPYMPVNHLEGHALTVRLTNQVSFPYLLLLASGGHCQFLAVHQLGQYQKLGETLDDAAGECFDKVAKMLGLPFPGGPSLEKAADLGDAGKYHFPLPLRGRADCMLSFSGLKTNVRLLLEQHWPQQAIPVQDVNNISAAFQHTVARFLADKAQWAIRDFLANYPEMTDLSFVLAGGVAANQTIRQTLSQTAKKHKMNFVVPPPRLCTDNAVMIAWAGFERWRTGDREDLSFAPRPRWPLDQLTSPQIA